jgi:hypothetical protein
MRIDLRNIVTTPIVTLTAAYITMLALACGGEATVAVGNSSGSPSSNPPKALRLIILPESAEVALGTSFVPSVFKVMSDSSRVPLTSIGSVTWQTTNPGIVDVHVYTGYAVALAPGEVLVRADADGLFAFAAISVLNPKAVGTSDALIVDSFSVIDFQQVSAPAPAWAYAPQIRVHTAPGRKATVLNMQFSLPKLGYTSEWKRCGALLTQLPRELNGVVIGEWFLAFGVEQELTGGEATVTISFVDDAGTLSARTVRGPIVRGSPPEYGQDDGGSCFHGYGGYLALP